MDIHKRVFLLLVISKNGEDGSKMKIAEKRVQVFVHPEFKKILFKRAIDENMPVISYTKKIANEANPINRLVEDMNGQYKKKKKFDFM